MYVYSVELFCCGAVVSGGVKGFSFRYLGERTFGLRMTLHIGERAAL